MPASASSSEESSDDDFDEVSANARRGSSLLVPLAPSPPPPSAQRAASPAKSFKKRTTVMLQQTEVDDEDFEKNQKKASAASKAAPAEKPQRRSSIYRDDGKADLRAVVRLIKACNLFSKGFGADDAAAKKTGSRGSGRLADGGSRGSSRLSSRGSLAGLTTGPGGPGMGPGGNDGRRASGRSSIAKRRSQRASTLRRNTGGGGDTKVELSPAMQARSTMRQTQRALTGRRPSRLLPGQEKRAKFPTSKAPISAVFHSFRLTFGRAIISRNGLEAWMLFSERARAEHSR